MILTKYSINLFYMFLFISFLHLLTSPIRPLYFLGIDRIYLALYMLPSLAILILTIKYRLFYKLNFSEAIIVIIPFLSILISIFNQKSHSHLFMDVLKPVLFISLIVFFRNINIYKLCKGRYIDLLMRMNLYAGIFSIFFLVYLYESVGGFYLSATNVIFLIPVFYFISKKKKLLSFISIVSIVYSGKRGVLLSYLIALFTQMIAKSKHKYIIASYLVFFIIIIVGLFQSGKLDDILIVKKMISGIDAAGDQNILFALGGRAEEIIASLKIFYKDPILLLTGAGPGYTYDMKSILGLELYDVHGTHFSPVGLFTIYGPVFFITIYLYFFINLKRAYNILKLHHSGCSLISVAALFFIANFINSFTAFAIFTPAYYAISIGIINNIHIKGTR